MEYFNFVFWKTRIFNRTIISWRNERAKNLEIFLKNWKVLLEYFSIYSKIFYTLWSVKKINYCLKQKKYLRIKGVSTGGVSLNYFLRNNEKKGQNIKR